MNIKVNKNDDAINNKHDKIFRKILANKNEANRCK